METLLRIGKYLRSPLVACGTYNTVAPPYLSMPDLDHVQLSFYHFFGRNFALISNARRILSPATFWAETSLNAGYVEREISEVTFSPHTTPFSSLSVLPLGNDEFTANIDKLLLEAKAIVPLVLESDTASLLLEHGWTEAGSASGEGFTCSVYRKEFAGLLPVYIICGDLDISVDTFHRLACDVDFRHRWDDQFHQVTSQSIPQSEDARLMNWVVKWPWPMAPRSYRYVLTPHVLDSKTKLVMAASVTGPSSSTAFGAVPVKEYFGITAASCRGLSKSRFCVFHFDDPHLPGTMPGWLERYVAQSLLPAFPKKIIAGAKLITDS